MFTKLEKESEKAGDGPSIGWLDLHSHYIREFIVSSSNHGKRRYWWVMWSCCWVDAKLSRACIVPGWGRVDACEPREGVKVIFNPWGGAEELFIPWGGVKGLINPWGGLKGLFNPWGWFEEVFMPWGGVAWAWEVVLTTVWSEWVPGQWAGGDQCHGENQILMSWKTQQAVGENVEKMKRSLITCHRREPMSSRLKLIWFL